MKEIKEQLKDACEDNYQDSLDSAKNMEYRHGDRYNDPEFKSETNLSFYTMIVDDLINIINKPILILKHGSAYIEGEEIKIINPFIDIEDNNINDYYDKRYYVQGKVCIVDNEWKVEFEGKLFEIDDLEFDY